MAKKKRLLLFRGDKPLWIIVVALFLASLLVVYSATAAMAYREVDGNTSYYLFRQARFIMIGFFMIIVVHWIDYKYYARYARALFQLSVVLVVLAYVIGVSLNDAARWLKIPGLGFTFQPSELLKVTLVVVIAQQLGVRQAIISKIPLLPALTPAGWGRNPQRNFDVWYKTTRPLVIPVVVATLVVLPSNLSTAAILWVTCMVMFMIGRVRQREINRLMFIAVSAVVMLVAGMYMLGVGRAETWVNRVVNFAQPAVVLIDNKQTSRDSYQVRQAEIAIASGGVVGKGPGNSTQRSQLPHPYSDFAYAFIIEEYGIVGGGVVFILYLWIFYRAGFIVRRCNRPSQGLMVLGLSLVVTMQAFVNMSVSVGLMPVTGQSLPLISMGGSSVFFTCIAIGMILGVSRESERDQQELESQRRREAMIAAGGEAEDWDEEQSDMPPILAHQEQAVRPKRRPLILGRRKVVDDVMKEDIGDYDGGDYDDDLTVIDRGDGSEWASGSVGGGREVVDLMDDEDYDKR